MPKPRSASPVYTEAEKIALVTKVDHLVRVGGLSISAAEIQARCESGMDVRRACLAVGISEHRYYKWRRQLAPPPTMRPVEVTAMVPVAPTALALAPAHPSSETPSQVPGLVLVAPGGYRVEGLVVESAAWLLRALS